MNARTPFRPLIRNEFGIDHSPRLAWGLGLGTFLVIGGVCSFMPLFILIKPCEGNLATFFSAFGDLCGFAMVWWAALSSWLLTVAMVPGTSNPMRHARAFEFMFTRAIDRRTLFRVRMAVVWTAMLGPLVLNLAIASFHPDARFETDGTRRSPASLDAMRADQYRVAFPQSQVVKASALNQSRSRIIPRGAVHLATWVFWLGLAGLLAMQAYCALVANRVQHHPWLALAVNGWPVLFLFLLAPRVPRLCPRLVEGSFLLAAQFPMRLAIGMGALWVGIQVFAERRFARLEIH